MWRILGQRLTDDTALGHSLAGAAIGLEVSAFGIRVSFGLRASAFGLGGLIALETPRNRKS
jgi:hypothetical protein